jgi:hypothetical protein
MMFAMALSLLAPYSGSGQSVPPALPLSGPAGFVWNPALSPAGPVLVVASLSNQQLYVYRNGIRIGASGISTGKTGYETPVGTYTILQKEREHYSNLYDNAPMPYMERLTWSGVALHAGSLPGHPASHGCIRLPLAFAEKLYAITTTGATLVIVDKASEPMILRPTSFLPASGSSGAPPEMADDTAPTWLPENSPSGPMSIVLSTHSQEVVVVRNATEIGRAKVEMAFSQAQGTRAYMLLEGDGSEPGLVVSDRPALRWLDLDLESGRPAPAWDPRTEIASGRLRIPEDFARKVYDQLVPGTTLVITDEPLAKSPESGRIILQADGQ